MNWVGGIRNRIKLKQEKKLQKEFFERKRLEKKLNIPNATSVNTTSSNTNGQMKISQDILALQVITKTHDKPVNKRKHEIRQPTRIDFDRPSHSKKYKQEEMIDLPLPSSLKPSKLEFTGAMDLAEIVKPQMFPGNQDSRTEYTESEVNSFEFKNNFENITRYRQHSSYGDQESENISHLHQDVSSRGSIFQKNNDAVFEKRQIQQTYQVEESPFIPFAAPAPHSLATRTTSFINTSQYSKNDFSSPGKSHSPIHTSTPLKTWTQQHDMDAMINIEDINQARKIEKCTTNKRTEPEGEGLFFQKRIYRKNEHDNNIIKNCQDTSMQSPAQNEVTIDCLNKSDPQSFLTDLRLLDELIAESQRTITNPSSDISLTDAGDTNPSRQQDNDNQPECNDAALIHAQCKHQCKTDEKSSTDEVWRNFVMNTRQNICKKQLQIYEQKRPSSREDTILENLSYNTTGNSQTSRSKAAEELKEVMAVKQYESSQESSYDSSWSSTGSEKYYNRTIRTTASTNKSPIKKVKETTTSETKKPSSSQDLPSSATSEQLANSQTQVYTLGFSHGLQKRHKELPPRSQDPERSNLSSFRIYPLSRSQDKSTQTDHNKTKVPLVCHKYVECQIQENKIQERSTEISGHEQSETTSNGTAITNNDPTSTAVRTDQDYSVEQGHPFVKTSSEIDHTKYPVHLNASVSSKTLVSDLLSKTSTTTNYNELAPVTLNGTTDATFNGSSVTIVELCSVTTPKTSDQPLSTNHIQVNTPHHSSVTTHKTKDQSLSTNTFHVITPDHPSLTIPKTSDQPSSTEIVPVTTPNKSSMTTPKTSDQPSSTEIVPVTTPNKSSMTTPKTSDQPSSTEIVPVTTPNKSSMTTPKTSDQPSSTEIVPATTPNKSSMTIPKTSDQPSSTEILPVTTPDNPSMTTPKTRKQPSPAKTFPLTTACVNPSVTTPSHLPGGSSHQLAEATQNDPKSTNSDQLRQTAPKAAAETSIVITTSSNPVNTFISTSEYSTKTFQTTTSASFPPTKLNEASASSSCGLKEANLCPPSGNQAIKPIDCNETAAEVQQEENYQNTIKKLEKDIEQLQNINVYQSIVIKFLQM